MKNTFKLFLLFLGLDLITKLLAVSFEPNNIFMKLAYNPNMAMGLKANSFLLFILPILFLPFPLLASKYLKIQSPLFLSLCYAGCFGNYIGRFSEQGVVDFINGYFFIFNLADLFLVLSFFIYLKESRIIQFNLFNVDFLKKNR